MQFLVPASSRVKPLPPAANDPGGGGFSRAEASRAIIHDRLFQIADSHAKLASAAQNN
jgi:hypothetical protein